MFASACGLKPRQLFQFLHALFDVGAFDFGRASQAETFTAERRGDAAINHRAPDVDVNRAFGRRQKSHHAADERIARAGRVNNLVQWIRRADEKSLRPGQNRAVRAFLDDDVFWAELVDFFQRGEDVVFLRELMRLAVVQHEAVNARQEFQ